MPPTVSVFWFRRDLRLHDNHGLYQALCSGLPVVPVFIFDEDILNQLTDKQDKRVSFIHRALVEMQKKLVAFGSTLDVRCGVPDKIFAALAKDYNIATVFTNHDYEPYARKRDIAIQEQLAVNGIGFQTFKDQVIFEQSEVVKEDGFPYSVYTPFSKRWKATLNENSFQSFPSEKKLQHFYKQAVRTLPSLESIGFTETECPAIEDANETIIRRYHETRDTPALPGTTRMGIHLRFGTVSVRIFRMKQTIETNKGHASKLKQKTIAKRWL